uniref:Sodium/potassium-transporting ATPase subunit beta n=2 Tax=Clastoptera arizonana TaxID=38151 RepID=A0A1B6E7W0_9HEMI
MLKKIYFLCFLQFVYNNEIRLTIHPRPADEKSSLIWFNKTSYDFWTNQLDNYLEVYRFSSLTVGRTENLVECDYHKPPLPGKVCNINPEKLSPCVVTNYFGYRNSSPCIFLEIDLVDGWKPKYFMDYKTLPESMPNMLRKYIHENAIEPEMWETVWVSCDGEMPADKEFVGPITYIPGPGIPGYFYPFNGQKGYLNPIIAIQFETPITGLVINIECTVWAANIKQNKEQGIGSARFQLLID